MIEPPLPPTAEELTEVTSGAEAPTRRKRALWGALAALGIAAGAVAVRAADESTTTTVPVSLGSAGEAAMAADMSMRAYVHYVAGPELPELGGSGPAYRLPAGTTASRVVEVARAFGMSGEPTRAEGSWHLQDGDRSLDVYEGVGAQWSYTSGDQAKVAAGGGAADSAGNVSSSPACVGGPAVDCGPVDDPCVTGPATCEAPPTTIPAPPVDLPSAAEAKAIALDLLAATGMDLTDAIVVVEGPFDSYWVNVTPVVDGLEVSGTGASVTIGSEGVVLFASGSMSDPEPVGDVDVVDTAEAIERLNEGSGGWSAYTELDTSGTATGSGYAEAECVTSSDGRESCTQTSVPPCPVTDLPTTTAVADPDAPVASNGATEPAIGPSATFPSCGPVPMPVDPPEPIEVVLTDAEVNLVLLPSSDGSGDGYLVPGYRFTDEDGGTVDQPAIADDALEPIDVDPQPAPYPGAPCAQPEPGPDGAVADICLDPGGPPTTPTDPSEWKDPAGPSGSGQTGSSPGSPGTSPGGPPDEPVMSIPPGEEVRPVEPCVLPEPGPNGEVPAIACADPGDLPVSSP